MDDDRIARIEKWFTGEHESGDFIRAEACYPFSVIGPTAISNSVVYCTKAHVALRAVEETSAVRDFGVICGCGLPNESDVSWLRNIIDGRELVFIGDLDPADIMVYAWLREQLPSISVSHRGINDRFIADLGVVPPKSYQIRLGDSETAAVSQLDSILDDIQVTLGPECYELLQSGYKIELEAIVSALGVSAPLLRGVGD